NKNNYIRKLDTWYKSNYLKNGLYAIMLLLFFVFNGCKNVTEPEDEVWDIENYMFDNPKENFDSIPFDDLSFLEGKNLLGKVANTFQADNVVDLSSKMPPVGDQNPLNSCVSWALGYTIQSYLLKVYRNYYSNWTTSILMSPSYMHYHIRECSQDLCNSSVIEGLIFLRTTGICSMEDKPYNRTECNNAPTQQQNTNAAKNKISSSKRIRFEDIQKCISKGYPVAAGVPVYDGQGSFKFPSPSADGLKYIWDKNEGKFIGWHRVVIVGYDDDNKLFKIQNSWGTNYGYKGFVWATYSILKNENNDFFIIDFDPVPDEPNLILTHNGASSNVTITINGFEVISGISILNPDIDIKFRVLPDDGYIVNSVTYKVGPGTNYTKITDVNGIYTIPANVITNHIDIAVLSSKDAPKEPYLEVSPTTLNFANTIIGSGENKSVNVKNTGTADLVVSVQCSNTDVFPCLMEYENVPIPPGETRMLAVRFAPQEAKVYNETITIKGTNSNQEVKVQCMGIGMNDPNEPVNLNAGLVAWYPLDGNANDKSGLGNHGVNYGAEFVTGRKGQACQFNSAEGKYISILNNTFLMFNSEITISLWYWAESLPPEWRHRLTSKGDVSLYLETNSYCFGFFNWPNANGYNDNYRLTTVQKPQSGQWTNIVVIYSSSEGSKIYVNGELIAATGQVQFSTTYVLNGSDNITLGGTTPPYNARKSFSYLLDDVRIYNRALNKSEVEALYKE
ncbi:MAG: hypothetical protein FWG85_08285, partial [Bacteroidetes bacterium]|nr:hypothetical protein [Bacteroidota bacterium]